ncbi:hypothetical protein DSO57_1009221 [Entomophthora muscae]|uniref:Uncharacterized protein n=1 Tax=Entomophthora muscae TaxID=34485 RepID=A0ACC2TIE1_9FUNG|nr:hypothetical protein DSO57_1009221 [Entomophthora muscae]
MPLPMPGFLTASPPAQGLAQLAFWRALSILVGARHFQGLVLNSQGFNTSIEMSFRTPPVAFQDAPNKTEYLPSQPAIYFILWDASLSSHPSCLWDGILVVFTP